MYNLQRGLSRAKSAFFLLIFLGASQLAWAQGQQIIFSATGDTPYGSGEVAVFQQQVINHNKYSPSAFFVHVGDIIDGGEACDESKYANVANIIKTLAVPAYITPGDNETVDCKTPSSGFNLFLKYYKNYEQNFCGAPFTEHQSSRPENWAFTKDGVLFMGINLVYGGSSAEQDAANWVTQQLQAKGTQVRAAAIFCHYAPNSSSTFSTPFRAAAAAFAKPVLYLHGHGHSWSTSYPFPEKNIFRVQVNKGGSEDPVQVTVTTDITSPATAFILTRKPWSAKTIVNMPPCANAGPDQSIAGATVTTLKGQAADDGDPNNSLTTIWSKVSGPGTVSFGNPGTPTTTASFSANGSYVLRLTANDGQLQQSDDVIIYVNSSGSSNGPVVSSFTPTSGAAGTIVTIFGSNFTGATDVAFNGTSATSFTANSSTQIVATVPEGATTGKIMITTPTSAGISASDFVVTGSNLNTFTFNPTDDAYVQSITPTSNFGTLEELRTETNNASDVATIYLKFNAAGVRGTLQSAKLRLRVTNGSTGGGSLFTVANDYQDASGPWMETGLLWSNAPVIKGAALGSLGSVSSGQTVELEVTTAFTGNGTYSFALQSSSSNAVTYSSKEGTIKPELVVQTTLTPPTISSFMPTSGTATTEVTITGSAFDGTTAVAFNGTPATFTVDSDTQIHTTVPIGASTGTISITNADGTGFSATNFTVLPPLIISSFTPANGPVGTEVTITGNRFSNTSAVNFNGTAATFIVDSNTQLRATVPAGATTGKISMTNAFGTNSSNANFVVTAPPVIASFTPSSGPAGTEVTITGAFFTTTTGVTINGNAASGLAVDSDTQIRVKVPAGAITGTGKIIITNPLGSATSAADFTITLANDFAFAPQQDAYVTSASPASNNGTAKTVQIRTSASEITQSYLKFEVTGASGALQSAKLRLYVSDPGPDGGSVHLVSNNYKASMTPWIESGLNWNNAPAIDGAALSSMDTVSLDQWVEFDVKAAIVGNGTYSFGLKSNNSDKVYYRSKENGSATTPQLVIQTTPSSAPSIASFAPDNGPEDTEVTILGNNLSGTTAVTFNGVPATIFTVESNTKLRANVPGNATTGKVKVTNAYGSGSFAKNFIVTATPVVTAFTPSSGSAGTEITITGSNFTGTTSVTINGQAAATIYIDSDAQIRAIVPANAVPGVGKIAVTNSAGSATSATDFTINLRVTFAPTHDTYVSSSSPAANYGTAGTVREKTSSTEIFYAYLKFDVTGLSSTILGAKLRLYVTNASPSGGAVYLVSNNYLDGSAPWVETGMNWTNAPSIGGTALSSVGAATAGQWVEFDVTPAITGDGTYSFGLMNDNADAVYFSSKESAGTTDDPQLVIQMALTPTQHKLTVNTVGSGSVTLNPPSANGSYNAGATVELTATPATGFQFSGWSGDLTPQGGANPATITMDGNKNVTARFTAIPSSSQIVHEESRTGGASGSTTVTTSTGLTGVSGNLYLAAISSRPRKLVQSVTGLGLNWTLVKSICSGNSGTTGMDVWMAQGTPSGNGAVAATFATAPSTAAIAVSRYSGVATANPVGNVIAGNTNGPNGACAGGVDGNAYSFNLTTTATKAVVYGAVALKARTHTPGAGYTERVEFNYPHAINPIGVAIEDTSVASASTVTVSGSFNGAVDWALVALEIKPATAPLNSTIVYEERQTGGSSSLTTVTTSASLTGVSGNLYLAAISSRPRKLVQSVTGLGLNWKLVKSICSGNNSTTGMDVWMAQGTPSGNGAVTATFATAPSTAAIAVSRYSGVAATNPIGNVIGDNTNGLNGACSGGADGNVYSLNLTTTATKARVYGAVALKAKTHTPAAGYTEQVEFNYPHATNSIGVAVEDTSLASASTVKVSGSFNGPVDWALVALEIKPLITLGKHDEIAASEDAAPPSDFLLEQNYPNPFNPDTHIRFGLPEASHVTIKIYSVTGAEVSTVVDNDYPAGTHAIIFQAKSLSSGVYFYVMQAGEVRKVRRLMLVK